MKQTEIGLIPEDWEVKSLGEILTIKHGYGFEGDSFSAEDNGFIVVTPGNFKLNGGFQKPQASIFYIGKYPKEFNLKPNDLVIMMTDLSKESDTLGNPAIIPDDNYQYLHNQRIGLINCNSDNFDKNYLFHLLCSKDYHKAVVSTAAGSTVKHTSPKRIYTIKLPITQNLQEQQRIAKALSDVDALISTTEKLIQKKKNIKQGAMQNLLTSKKRLPGFAKSTNYKQSELGLIPEDWEVKSLGESFDIGSSKRVFQSQWRKSGIPFYRAREIVILAEKNTVENELFIDETLYNQYKTLYGVPAVNDLLVTGVGTLGKVYKVQNTNPFYFKDGNIICLKNKGSINSDYVSYHFDYYIVKDQINDNSGKSTVGTYTINSARKTIIPVPSVPEQTAIANVLSSMDKEIETLNTNLEKYRNLKTAMMQQLLTGKIRLGQGEINDR